MQETEETPDDWEREMAAYGTYEPDPDRNPNQYGGRDLLDRGVRNAKGNPSRGRVQLRLENRNGTDAQATCNWTLGDDQLRIDIQLPTGYGVLDDESKNLIDQVVTHYREEWRHEHGLQPPMLGHDDTGVGFELHFDPRIWNDDWRDNPAMPHAIGVMSRALQPVTTLIGRWRWRKQEVDIDRAPIQAMIDHGGTDSLRWAVPSPRGIHEAHVEVEVKHSTEIHTRLILDSEPGAPDLTENAHDTVLRGLEITVGLTQVPEDDPMAVIRACLDHTNPAGATGELELETNMGHLGWWDPGTGQPTMRVHGDGATVTYELRLADLPAEPTDADIERTARHATAFARALAATAAGATTLTMGDGINDHHGRRNRP